MMQSKRLKVGVTLAAVAAVALLAATTDAFAQRQMTRLGNPGTRFTPPISSVAALQKTFKTKSNQAAVGAVLDKAGLASLTPQVLAALADGKVTDTAVAPGTGIRWMAVRRGGKPDLVLDGVWAGKAPFKAFAFTIEDGAKIYNFVVPKDCGNLALLGQSEQPMPECIRIAMVRDCVTKQVTFTAGGTAITNNQATVVKVMRDGKPVGELLPGSGFKATMPLQPGRYTFSATDKFGREFGTCERDVVVEACAAPAPPPPPPPPPATSCGALLTATKVKGGWDFVIDGSATGQGPAPATKAVIELIGPAGTAVPFSVAGKPMTEYEIVPPFTATLFVAKAVPGTYTVRAKATSAKGTPRSCESTVVVPGKGASGAAGVDGMDWFVDGAFGKQRRQYELAAKAPATGTVTPGFCDPMIGVKFGPIINFADGKASFAPAAGIAFMFGDLGDYDYGDNKYNNSSVMVEGVVNYHFGEKRAYVGTGIGLWDLFDGDHFTVSWIANVGIPMAQDSRGNKIYFIAEGRLFFDAPNGIDSNYQMWGGIRYVLDR
jgi:hypothetical protein